MVARLAFHSAVLAVADLVGIWLGFLVFTLTGRTNQLQSQLPVAVIAAIVLFVAWTRAVDAWAPLGLRWRTRTEAAWIYGLAFPWGAAMFVPLHLATQDYLTAASNLLALWAFQLFANLPAVAIATTGVAENPIETGGVRG